MGNRKALLLASDRLVTNCRMYAFELFEALFRDPEAVRVLKEEYGFTQHDIYRMTGEPLLYRKKDVEVIHSFSRGMKLWKSGAEEMGYLARRRAGSLIRNMKNKLGKSF